MAVDSSRLPQAQFNPLADNPFRTRDDVIAACRGLFDPLLPYFSSGRARVQVDASGSAWDRAACDLEGFARPLFGLAPLAAGGSSWEHWEYYRTGLKNGTDPSHPEYWGRVTDMDQRHVEAAALGYGLMLAPDHLWDPLDQETKDRVAEWLRESRNTEHANNNHKFFRVLVDLGLARVGVAVNSDQTEEYLRELETLYIGDGWYRDGGNPGDLRRIDYYNPFAMHFYGLTYAVHKPEDEARGNRFRARARQFAVHFQHWFADNGASIPYGRSLIYRHAVAAFWGALAVANEEALPWGAIKGLYLRNLRWWASQPISRLNDGVLTLGYAYPNQMMTERYSSTGSPWWSMKAFAPLCLPADHPFWAAEELPMPARPTPTAHSIPGMVFMHEPGHSIMLVSGPSTVPGMRSTAEKYSKFAYSSRYGFSVESDSRTFSVGAFDSMLALSDDKKHFRVREECASASLAGDMLFSRWHPWNDVTVETWLVPHGSWHLRVHRITSSRPLWTIEGGFAAPRTDFKADETFTDQQSAYVISTLGDFSGIRDASTPPRSARVTAPHGNTSVMFPRTFVPQLLGDIAPDTPTVFAAAVLAGPNASKLRTDWGSPPITPGVEELRAKVKNNGIPVEIVLDLVRTLE